MKEFLVSFLIFLIAISAFAYLYKKEPKTVEIPVAVPTESTQLKEENDSLKKQLAETPSIKYKTIYVEQEVEEEPEEECQNIYVPTQPVAEKRYLRGDDRFEPATPCNSCNGGWNPNDPRQPQPGQVSQRTY